MKVITSRTIWDGRYKCYLTSGNLSPKALQSGSIHLVPIVPINAVVVLMAANPPLSPVVPNPLIPVLIPFKPFKPPAGVACVYPLSAPLAVGAAVNVLPFNGLCVWCRSPLSPVWVSPVVEPMAARVVVPPWGAGLAPGPARAVAAPDVGVNAVPG